METITYLIFDGNCREAMTFYAKCLEADLFLSPYSEMPGDNPPVTEGQDWIMHARLTKKIPVLMASDSQPHLPVKQGDNFFVSLQCESLSEIEKLFAALGENGQIKMPLAKTFWAERFGMLTDQFGINWMFNLESPK